METAKLVNKRIYRGNTYCIGHLYLNGSYVCDTLEPAYRYLTSISTLEQIKEAKRKGKTAIPSGTYRLDLESVSPRFGNNEFYKLVCRGKLPRIVSIKGYAGVLIHCGNTVADTEGCLLVGENKEKGKVLNSRKAFERLMGELSKYKSATIEII